MQVRRLSRGSHCSRGPRAAGSVSSRSTFAEGPTVSAASTASVCTPSNRGRLVKGRHEHSWSALASKEERRRWASDGDSAHHGRPQLLQPAPHGVRHGCCIAAQLRCGWENKAAEQGCLGAASGRQQRPSPCSGHRVVMQRCKAAIRAAELPLNRPALPHADASPWRAAAHEQSYRRPIAS